jgi:hypothetical protein
LPVEGGIEGVFLSCIDFRCTGCLLSDCRKIALFNMANSLWRRPPSLFPKETLINMFHADAYRTSHLYYIIKMIRVLSITRSGPLIVSMSDFFLSIASGLHFLT